MLEMATIGDTIYMNQLQNSIEVDDFRRLAELHDMASNACELLKAMSNKWRLMILCQLSEGEKTVGELQGLLGVGQSAVSQHLAILRREEIVASRKDAQSIFYSLSGDEAIKVMATLHNVFCANVKIED
jgi:ArsR family transcriptional regulator, virulence genes transcriptional regulator